MRTAVSWVLFVVAYLVGRAIGAALGYDPSFGEAAVVIMAMAIAGAVQAAVAGDFE